MDKSVKFVSGNFIGNFFTYQKSPISIGEKIPDSELHHVHLFKGDLTDAISIDSYNPEEHLNRDGMLLHNVSNIQIHTNDSLNQEKKIYDFDQIVLKNVKVESSWEHNGKTYGILKGELVGKIKKVASVPISRDNDKPIPPPPFGVGSIQPSPPVGGDSTGWNKYVPPIIVDSTRNGGCLTSIWDILKWLLLLLFILFLLKQCKSCNNDEYPIIDDVCNTKIDSITKENEKNKREIDSLKNLIIYRDSLCNVNLEREKLQWEIDNLSSEIYFYGGTTKIRKYSEKQIDKIVEILNKNNQLEIEILGFNNGKDSTPLYYIEFNETMTIDKARALTIKQMLVDKGIDGKSIAVKGMGESKIDPSDEDSMETMNIDGEIFKYNANMRVEIIIVKY